MNQTTNHQQLQRIFTRTCQTNSHYALQDQEMGQNGQHQTGE